MENKHMNQYFYCYSKRMAHFIRAFDIRYVNVGINEKTNTKYYVFNKSERLDKIIQLYNSVKYTV